MSKLNDWLRPLADPAVMVTSAVYGGLIALTERAGLFGLALLVLVGASLWRYAYVVLRGVAQGRPTLQPPDIESMNPVGNMRLLAHFALFAGLLTLADNAMAGYGIIGPMAGAAVAAMLLTVFPASAALMALGMNLAHALNPAAMVGVIRILGRDYLLLVAGCTGVMLVASNAEEVVAPHLGLFAGLVATVLAVWVALAVFALIGAAIHWHRDAFDIPGEWRSMAERDAEAMRSAWRSDLDLAYGALRSGEIEKGYDVLRNLIARNGASVEIYYWLFENMIDWAERDHAYRVADRLIARLVEIGDLPAALELCARCRRLGGQLAVRPGTLRLLIRYAREIGQSGLASELRAELDGSRRHSE